MQKNLVVEFVKTYTSQVGLTNPKTMSLLPTGAIQSQQKIVIGDHDGIVQVFSIKKGGETSHAFKTLPNQNSQVTRYSVESK